MLILFKIIAVFFMVSILLTLYAIIGIKHMEQANQAREEDKDKV